ncbi:hypothetical protein CVT25_003791 [Psilocybe cyanescens]|uniref:Carboxylesterase type B domain-containing protein n=1 Tax=Psilocybe cyanescens TaxID=93625 RepID=A0A409WX67_PSICY|nr:hypothetical protein CVT25_003791 [Psilocybe cyanescens]
MAIHSPLFDLFIFIAFSSVCCALAAPAGTIDIKLKTGVFRGVTQPNGTDRFLGIPFAQPPVGSLRFKAPIAITTPSSAIHDASAFGNACPQLPDPTIDLGAPVAEDCLFLNVFRPPNLKSDAKLPVLFWIHVGGSPRIRHIIDSFYPSQGHSHQSRSRIASRSIDIGKPIIFVSTNYRLNTFGFLASSSVPAEDLNAGLHDQRIALEFVQDNIEAFGGDPNKVTIWGQSAGAGSVQAHFVYPSERALFRAGIADSATGPFKNSPDVSTFDKPGKPFARLLAATGCASGKTAVSCLQKAHCSKKTLMNISNTMINETLNNQLWQPAVGPKGSFVPERASEKMRSGDFLHLPYIGGTNVNEGTFFTPSLLNEGLSGATEVDAFKNFIGHLVIDNSTLTDDVVNEFISLFPANDPSNGAPFNTGDSLFDRASAWYTDQMFLSARRFFFQHASALQPMFAYYYGELIPGNDITRGVTHQLELELLFGPLPPVAEVETDFANTFRDFYINFVNDLNPGADWLQFTPTSPRVLQLIRNNLTMIPDTFDLRKTDFSNSAKVLNEFQKFSDISMAKPSPFYRLFIAFSSVCCALALPAPGTVDVKLKTGIFRGLTQPNGTDRFLGIPFAQPPVGNLRFRAPVAIAATSNVIHDASVFGNACPQAPDPRINLGGAPVAEDCLFLNVFRPPNLKSNAKLPVLFWIHGGAFTSKSVSSYLSLTVNDKRNLLKHRHYTEKYRHWKAHRFRIDVSSFHSTSMCSVIDILTTYQLASSSIPAEDLNAGLQDQRIALEFVQDNIAAFGGDPKKVTIWGQSAGAGSVQAHFLFPSARALFRAGIADSSTGPFKNSPDVSTFDKPGKPFSRLLAATGCAAGKTAVSCLQKVPFQASSTLFNTMIDATLNNQLWQPAVGPKGSFFSERASEKMRSGDFLHLPYIGGTNVNEGTFFTPTLLNEGLSGATEVDAFKNFIGHLVIDNSTLTDDVVNEFISLFPANDPSNGAPFNTGDSLFDRASAWYTDQMFLSARRFFFQHASALQPMFAYYYGEFIPGNDITRGVTHQLELELLFGPLPPVAEVETDFSNTFRDFYINFVNDLNPGAGWPQFTPTSPRVLQLIRNNITMIPDSLY